MQTERERIYLDNAATSWPKPPAVYEAVDRYQRECGAPVGRSAYQEANQVNQAVAAARVGLARLIGADDARQIIFTFNGTDALNMAIGGTLRDGDHVITTVVEHNSVLRPLSHLQRGHLQRGHQPRADRISLTHIGCDCAGMVDPDDVRRAIGPKTRLIVLTHASNVTGAIQRVTEIGKIAKQHGVLFLVDAAQTLGHMPVMVDEIGADLLAAPGHKGLLGPLGTGILYIRSGVEPSLESIRQGGTGTQSSRDIQPDVLPMKYESGSVNTPGILGLGEGVDYLRLRGLGDMRRHHEALAGKLLDGFRDIPQVVIHGPDSAGERVGVVSITLDGYDPQEVAATLDAAYRIQVRSGIHCAPRMHEALGTNKHGGTIRFSLGPFTTAAQIETVIDAVAEMAAEAAVS